MSQHYRGMGITGEGGYVTVEDWPRWPETDDSTIRRVGTTFLSGRLAVSGARSRWRSRNVAAAERIADTVGRRHAILTTSGSSAIVVALQAAGIGPGDTVLMPATTWVSCATAVMRVGAMPAFFDGTADSPCLIGAAPDVSPAAVLGIHLYAQHYDVGALRAAYPSAILIEDASHSHFSAVDDGRRVGTLGDISIMSLQATKILACGEGGVVLTDDPELAARMESLVMDSRRRAAVTARTATNELEPALLMHGANHALSEASAALLLDQLERFDDQAARRSDAAHRFVDRMSDAGWRVFAAASALKTGNFYGMAVEVPDARGDRQTFIEQVVTDAGLSLDTVYPPVPEGPLFRPFSVKQYERIAHHAPPTPVARRWHERHVVVPHHAFLAGLDNIDRLADAMIGRPVSARPVQARPTVDVVVISGGTRPSLTAALDSVRAQRVDANVRITVWLDLAADGERPAWLDDAVRGLPVAELRARGGVLPAQPFERISALRQLAAGRATGDFVAFLDDDNVWDADHLAMLLAAARSGFPAVHSWRRLVGEDGKDAPVRAFPWLPAGPAADERLAAMEAAGVMKPGDSVVRDRADAGMVDMGEWLFDRVLLSQLRFGRSRTEREVAERLGEDDIILEQLLEAGVPVRCTGRASLRYRLGGMSNPESTSDGEVG
ncbi:Glutamine--scyllo-inositol transaminase [Micromonospora sp. L5]|uniref:DegT/DnrJ/EryC1/StrS family aminotransferase n=1 Tax=Micromonospora sp. (strain L5) TaxID=648999 RepID=UPI0001C45C85|nr:DegT/DnrJ/EryC1/StrS family aminotransferase [Micromonospora sp. L5]ADU06397.1 Glutamine--scyllo-inositol transaminase [Micromonospora sp. L5]